MHKNIYHGPTEALKRTKEFARMSMPSMPAMPKLPAQASARANEAVAKAHGMAAGIVKKVQKRVGY